MASTPLSQLAYFWSANWNISGQPTGTFPVSQLEHFRSANWHISGQPIPHLHKMLYLQAGYPDQPR